MAPVTCKVCGGKAFKTDEAYAQHARDSKTHHLKEKQALSQSSPSSGEPVPSGSAAPSVAQVLSRPETPTTVVVAVVRQPYAHIRSLYRLYLCKRFRRPIQSVVYQKTKLTSSPACVSSIPDAFAVAKSLRTTMYSRRLVTSFVHSGHG